MARSNYSDIKTLTDLDDAIRENRVLVKKQEEAVRDSFSDVQSFYSPQNLAAFSMRRAARSVDFYSKAIAIIRILKRILQK